MATMLREPAIDQTDATSHRVSMPSEHPELIYSNQVDPAARSDEVTARPHEAQHRLIVMWAEAALRHANLRDIDDPPGFVATVAGLDGVWAHGESLRDVREELLQVLIDWASLKIEHGDDDIPSIDGVSLSVSS